MTISHAKPDRLRGLVATLALLVYLVGVPTLLIAINAVPSPSNFGWTSLTAPDDGTVALAAIGVVAWIAWAIFAVTIAVEVDARLRGHRAPLLPGLKIPQLLARRLVATAALLFLATPASLALLPTPHAAATQPPAAASPPPYVDSVTIPARSDSTSTPTPTHTEVPTTTYVAVRNDSLWKIAEQQLGDGARYLEIFELNRDKFPNGPSFLEVGTHLRIPASTNPETYVVRPGDTLSQIAQDELGDANAYPTIVNASRETLQSDGEFLTNPNLIHPGWALTIPSQHATAPQAMNLPPRHAHAPAPAPRPVYAKPPEDAGPSADTQTTSHVPSQVDADQGWITPAWLLPGVAGAGAFFAGSLFLALRRQRRTQQRYRQPGQRITPPPPELRDLEKSVQATGSVTAPRIEDLDRILRTLPTTGTEGPRLLYAVLELDRVRIHLREPADLESPWSGDEVHWTCRLRDEATETGDSAPYPLLVSIGQDSAGGLVLLNLEELGCLRISGDDEKVTALGRHIAAELGLNPWSNLVDIELFGLGAELTDIDPGRIHRHSADDIAFLERLAQELESEDPTQAPDQFRALLTTRAAPEADSVRKIAKIVAGYQGRAAVCVLTLQGEPEWGEEELQVTAHGSLRISNLDLDLVAAGLSAEEVRACASLMEATRLVPDLQPATSAASPTLAEPGGALNPAHTTPRPAGPAGPTSLLPLASAVYSERAATTQSDIDSLAPCATAETRSTAHERDPSLDDDLAQWHSQTLTVPKLTLLGPVRARTQGDARKTAHRRAYYLEVLAYLVLHPGGVTAIQMADDLGIRPERARNDLSIVRTWLGKDSSTEEQYLPNARQTHTTGEPATYKVKGVLSDLDLFRRLHTRGQSKGADGIDDLREALGLVTGEPFSDLRQTGWSWLLDGERIDHIMTCAIADVAHIVTTHALATDDLERARFAADTGNLGAPYDEVIQLDLVAVADRYGDYAEASRQLFDDVLNRTDDNLGPIDSPPRSVEIIRRRAWNTSRAG